MQFQQHFLYYIFQICVEIFHAYSEKICSQLRHYCSYCIMIHNIQINYIALFVFCSVVSDYFCFIVFKYCKCDKFRFINVNFKNYVLHKLVK